MSEDFQQDKKSMNIQYVQCVFFNLKFKFVCNNASVKSTVLQNCSGKKNTPWQTKTLLKLSKWSTKIGLLSKQLRIFY